MRKAIVTSPAERVIRAFGGVRETARALELNPSSVCRWRKPKKARGSGGLIPSEHHVDILVAARQLGKNIRAEDLIAL